MSDSSSDYFRTIVFLCGDFLGEVEDIGELSGENRYMRELVDSLLETEAYGIRHVLALEGGLGRYQSKLTSLFARYPDVVFVDTLLRRITSLREMCVNCVDSFR
ncbi:MAG: hypothetical protein AB2L13_19220 [Spirochaetota bacterium]